MPNPLMRVASHQQSILPSLLKPHFERHLEASAGSACGSSGSRLPPKVEKAQSEVCALLETISRSSRRKVSLSDSVLSYGERLSSLLLTAVFWTRRLQHKVIHIGYGYIRCRPF